MFISWLRQNKEALGPLRSMAVSAIALECKESLRTVHEGENAINAFHIMGDEKVTGLAVVDDDGVLVSAISITDLRAVGEGGEFFNRLFRPIKEFKEMARQEFPRLAPKTHYSNKKVPRRGLFVTPEQTFEAVLDAMSDGNIHRVFVCPDAVVPRPTHVISQLDLLRMVLEQIISDAGSL
jgi:CBS domain-containing protein